MRWMLIGVLVLAACGGAVCESRGVVSNADFAMADGGLDLLVADAGCPEAR